ncbi:hypothetical protein P4E94_19190 [Pontiellaceae bacterium B12219]|nr:hypothetical protein [Pontiellaceae bacterium B12219]
MNEEEINRIFQTRYTKAVVFMKRFKVIYSVLCLAMALIGIYVYTLSKSVPAMMFFIILSALCYFLLDKFLFRRWSENKLKKILQDAEQSIVGSIWGVQSGFGIHQINYSYRVGNKKIKAYDLVNRQQINSVYEGLEIPVRYIKDNPKLGYIEI